jgi:hypothetical protein
MEIASEIVVIPKLILRESRRGTIYRAPTVLMSYFCDASYWCNERINNVWWAALQNAPTCLGMSLRSAARRSLCHKVVWQSPGSSKCAFQVLIVFKTREIASSLCPAAHAVLRSSR